MCRVVTVGIGVARQLRIGVTGGRIVSVHIPVHTLAGPLEDPVHGYTGRRRGGKEQRASETVHIGLAEDQVAVARQDTNVVAVLVERMLPATRADDTQQRELARVHVRVAVVRLVRILRHVGPVHVVGHRAAVDHEIRGKVGLGRHVQGTSGGGSAGRHLLFRFAVHPQVHLGELEQVFPVVAGTRVVVGGVRQPIVKLGHGVH